MLGTYIHMYMSLWCICNLIEPILRHRKWLNNHIIQGPDNVLVYVYVSSRGHESCLSHAFWVLPHSERKRQNKPFQIETFHCFFFVALAIQGFSFAHSFRQTGVLWFTWMGFLLNWKGCVPWTAWFCARGLYGISPVYILYIYTVYIHLHLHIHTHIHTYIYIYYIHILIDCEPFLPSRFKWTSETPAKPQRQQWIDVLFSVANHWIGLLSTPKYNGGKLDSESGLITKKKLPCPCGYHVPIGWSNPVELH